MLSQTQRSLLLDTARKSIRHGLDRGKPLSVDPDSADPALSQSGACFVTLHKHGQLRGCIGSLQAWRPLLEDIAENAFSAAFRDPRFAPLEAPELDQLDIEISVLNPAEPLTFDSQHDLLQQLRPGVDGLILEDGTHRGTFLPSVWESLPDPDRFLQQLKLKAGLPAGYWSGQLKVSRYTTESFGELPRVTEH